MASSSDVITIDSVSDAEEAEAPDLPDVLVGSGEYQIVGIRYYSGVAHPGEFVTLVREPQNRASYAYADFFAARLRQHSHSRCRILALLPARAPAYDRNAIRVDNLDGED